MNLKLRVGARTLALAAVVSAFAATTTWAQTPEGTVITNRATVNWTDANGNSYAPASGSVSVTVGFQAGVDVIAAGATATPASPSNADTLTFQVANIGNGTDSVTISESIGVPGIITVTGYRLGVTTYATLGDLNTALAGTAMVQSDTITIRVVHDIASGQGGASTVYTLTAASRRDASASDSDATTVSPSETIAVSVTPDGGQLLQRLPSNSANYSLTFTVENAGNGVEDFDLLASNADPAVIAIVSVNGVAGDSTRLTGLAAGASQTIEVGYSVADVAGGSSDTLTLRARSVTQPTTSDAGFADLRVVRPAVSIAQDAFRDDQVTPIGADTLVPGEFIQYKITVTNNGDEDAVKIHVDDLLPSEVTFVSATADSAGWTITNTGESLPGNDVDADLAGALVPNASRFFWIRVVPPVSSQVPLGTEIRSVVQASYEASNGLAYQAQSDTLVMFFGRVARVSLGPPRSIVTDPGMSAEFDHTLANLGNATDSIMLTATSRVGWPVRVYLDANGNGMLEATEVEITGPVTLAAGATAQLLVAVDIPGSAMVRGTIDTVDLRATSLVESSTSDAVQDILEVRDVGIIVSLNTLVDRATATTGDTLTYTITYSASGPNTAANFAITDPIPVGTSYLPGMMRWNGTPLTDAADDDAGFFDVANNRVVFRIGNVTGGDNGTVTFQVRVGG